MKRIACTPCDLVAESEPWRCLQASAEHSCVDGQLLEQPPAGSSTPKAAEGALTGNFATCTCAAATPA